MAKRAAPKPPGGKTPARGKTRNPLALNAQLNRQTRKVLGKHYRAKFGVK
jgi:hypothetical protein